jgi:hypothetical protein
MYKGREGNMTDLIFAFMQAYGGDERESLLLARSLRKFGGALADQPLWLMVPHRQNQLSKSALQGLRDLDVQVHGFEVPEDALRFPFGCKVYAAAAAESLASSESEILVWMDSDTLFAGEPSEFLLGEGVGLGYRPVMLKNISSLYDEPLNAFWEFIYHGCSTSVDKIPPMATTVDEVCIRPQYNAGILSVRPKMGMLGAWRDNFEKLYQRSELTPYYQEHVLYRIFVHQSILSATVLAILENERLQDLGSRINFPMFLDAEPDLARGAVTFRYDEYEFFKKPGWDKKVALKESVKEWLLTQVEC